ncbi:PREDICTED: pentatricopeptide repeat-containing protein At4g21300 [Nelumbo nucifera]|uniref:Pentatricopeptide repeat-containing protein At4g21300 n=2 Tax=Nelumbo nucifera TaxID=4432 RepID=A0A822ZIY4_NELNU|nr:PREDICTED: pentatricopeptide repeat-containing protein At4g21300 [Nelumbo nucifera]DAD43591.1 TPA_asm: hypothetical protein HUJ06_001821 [Nelumbo nucifera]
MKDKYLFSIYKCLPCIAAFGLRSMHVSCQNVVKSAHNLIDFDGILADRFASLAQSCSHPSTLRQGRQVHAQVVVNGLSESDFLETKILAMYVLCKSLIDAQNMFFRLDWRYPLPWNWMIRGFTMMGSLEFALLYYFKLLAYGVCPDKYTFLYVIKACCGLSAINLGKWIHKTIHLMGFEMDIFISSSLIKMYTENDSIDDAKRLFDIMPQKDSVLWNVMLNGYVRNGDADKAIEVFRTMRTEMTPNSVTLACILSIYASKAIAKCGTQLHGLAIRCGLELDPPVANTLLALYSKCRHLSDAYKLLDLMPQIDLVAWNGMIAGYVQNGFMDEARGLLNKMLSSGFKPDSITLASFLPSVSDLANLKQCKEIHGYIIRHGVHLDVFLNNSLIDVYFKCRDVDLAEKVFNQANSLDVVICTTMISGYVLNGMNSDALGIFRCLLKMKMKPNSVTLASVLPSCAGLVALKLGKELHGNILRNGHEGRCYVASALTDMYAKSGRLDIGHRIFWRMVERDTVCWNSMIANCSQNGKPEEAIDLFRQMGFEGVQYDCVSISAALSACANLPALNCGKQIHGFMMKGTFSSDLFAESALIDMYAKCGNLVLARRVFDLMQVKNEVSWNSIIAAYGTHGHIKDSLDLFHKMLEEGIQPDHVTFLAIISACDHVGNVDEGFHYFRVMTERYGIMARMEHYACMVDLFGRAGRLLEALDIIRRMPFNADAGIWGALLGACRVHGNVELAELASKHLFELDPQNSGYYVLLSNVHADAGQWECVLKVRSLMKERGVQKLPGYSWIEIKGITHVFMAADRSHPQSVQIYLLLKILLLELRKEGYVPQPYLPMHPQTIHLDDQVRFSSILGGML